MNKKIFILILGILVLISILYFVNSTAWDVSTAYNSTSFNITPQVQSQAYDIFFNSSGNKMYITNLSGPRQYFFQYTLSTPWDISTATYDNINFSHTEDSDAKGIFINSSGNKLYVAGDNTNKIHQFTLSTPWDISTATYDNINFSLPPGPGKIGRAHV